MAKIPGRFSRALISPDGGQTWTYLNGIMDLTLNISVGEIKTTSHDDGDFESYVKGRKDATLELKMNYDELDAGQNILNTAAFNAQDLMLKIRMQELTGLREYQARGFSTKGAVAGPNDNQATYDVTLRLTGPVVQSVQ